LRAGQGGVLGARRAVGGGRVLLLPQLPGLQQPDPHGGAVHLPADRLLLRAGDRLSARLAGGAAGGWAPAWAWGAGADRPVGVSAGGGAVGAGGLARQPAGAAAGGSDGGGAVRAGDRPVGGALHAAGGDARPRRRDGRA